MTLHPKRGVPMLFRSRLPPRRLLTGVCLAIACQWANGHANDCHIEPSFNDIQPHAQNFGDDHLSSFGSGVDLHSPTPSWPEERKSDCTLLMDDMNDTSSFCDWDGGSCFSALTVDKSEVGKRLQLHHGVKPGGDKDRTSCRWEGCGKKMEKESISRHIVVVHLDNKTECGSCGKTLARLDSKLRHLKNPNRIPWCSYQTLSSVVAMIFLPYILAVYYAHY